MATVIAVLWVKILGTLVLASAPMLFTPAWMMEALGFPRMETTVFIRLLGLSTTALLVGYYGGIEQARRGEWPGAVLRMGLVSNASQGACIMFAAAAGAFASWGLPARALMLTTGAFVLGIAATIVVVQRSATVSSTARTAVEGDRAISRRA